VHLVLYRDVCVHFATLCKHLVLLWVLLLDLSYFFCVLNNLIISVFIPVFINCYIYANTTNRQKKKYRKKISGVPPWPPLIHYAWCTNMVRHQYVAANPKIPVAYHLVRHKKNTRGVPSWYATNISVIPVAYRVVRHE